MKKILLPFLIITVFCSSVFAQTKFGFKAGLNLSTIKKTTDNGFTIMPGINTGIFSNFYFSKNYFLDVELLHSAKGYNSILIPSGTTHNFLNYLSVPVLIGLKAGKKMDFVLGPEFSYLTKASLKIKTVKNTTTDHYEKYDVGIDFGASYHLSKKLLLEGRYIFGLSKVTRQFFIYDYSGTDRGYNTSGFNRVLQFNVSFLF